MSPSVTGAILPLLLDDVIVEGSGKDFLIGDLNARHQTWDEASNKKGSVIVARTVDTRHRILAPEGKRYRPRGRRGGSTPDVAVTNIRGATVDRAPEGLWSGVSDHDPMTCTMHGERRRSGGRVRRVQS